MPSTYTSNLRIEKQAIGEDINNWGDNLNAAIDRIDDAIAGWTFIDVSGQSQVVLTANNGVADQSRASVIVLNGTMTAHCIIYWPPGFKTVLVHNNVTASGGSWEVHLAQIGSSTAPYALGNLCGGLFYFDGNGAHPLGGGFLQVSGMLVQAGLAVGGSCTIVGALQAQFLTIQQTATIQGTCAAAQFVQTSDERLKSEVETVAPDDGRDWVLGARPVTYRLRDSATRSAGLIAQDVQASGYGHMVAEHDGHLALDYIQSIAYLTAHNKSLETRLAAIETRGA